MNLHDLKMTLEALDRALEEAAHVRPYKADAAHYEEMLKWVQAVKSDIHGRIRRLEPRIGRIEKDTRPNGAVVVFAYYGNSPQARLLFQYFPEELTFHTEELIGKTEREARELRAQRNRQFIAENC